MEERQQQGLQCAGAGDKRVSAPASRRGACAAYPVTLTTYQIDDTDLQEII